MNTKGDSLGDRMKGYENISRIYLTRRTPVIIRIDGKSFHNFTKGFVRPFDDTLIKSMQETAKYLCENISGCRLAYTQSDEISLLLIDYENINTQPWFDNNLQKLVSISASMASTAFNKFFMENATNVEQVYSNELVENYLSKAGLAVFDSRAFILPKEEVCNYFIWRQQDASRNSIQMTAQSYFSHKQLQGKNCDMLQDMLFKEHNLNWNELPVVYKRGSCIKKIDTVDFRSWVIDFNIPVFTEDRDYIDNLVFVGE